VFIKTFVDLQYYCIFAIVLSRYDYIEIDNSLFSGLSEEELSEIDGLEFQTKDLDREYLFYYITKDGNLYYEDYHYELVEGTGFFSRQLKRISDGIKESNFSGLVLFYGKPYESMYKFQARITNGKLKYIRLLSIK